MYLGHTTTIEHKIKLVDDEPIKERYRRVPPALQEEVRNHLNEKLDYGVIHHSHGPFTTPFVFSVKGHVSRWGSVWKINSNTVKDAQPLFRIEQTLDELADSTCFWTLGLKARHWQVEVADKDEQNTAFTVGLLGY